MIYKKTMDLRWADDNYQLFDEDNNLIGISSGKMRLQQRWENIQTGESKWDDIPTLKQ